MQTQLTRSPRVAAAVLRDGGVVAFPTETVYGLGANALDAHAVRRIFRAKGRPQDNPLIVHVHSPEGAARVARRIPVTARRLMDHFFPGPLTVIVPRHPDLPQESTAGLDTVGIRCPRHPVAQAFLQACGCPVAAPSANRSGRPSPTTWHMVQAELNGRIPCILKGSRTEIGLESTVIDCTLSRPVILREGAVTLEQIREVVPSVRAASAQDRKGPVRSPGAKYRHYAPGPRVLLVDRPQDVPASMVSQSAYIGLDTGRFARRPQRVKRCRTVHAYAKELFNFFHQCEQDGVRFIFCQCVPPEGMGCALMDRLRRASERQDRADPMAESHNDIMECGL